MKTLSPFLLLLSLFFSLQACTDEPNNLKLSHSPRALSILPDLDATGSAYTDLQGDTFNLKLIQSTSNYIEGNGNANVSDQLGEFERLEVQQSNYTYGSDTPFVRVFADVNTSFNSSLPANSQDDIILTIQDSNGTSGALLAFTYSGELVCSIENCNIIDTLQVDSNTSYTNVYYTDTTAMRFLLLNDAQGIIRIKTGNGNTYQRIN